MKAGKTKTFTKAYTGYENGDFSMKEVSEFGLYRKKILNPQFLLGLSICNPPFGKLKGRQAV
jgi:hypothetical protein